METKQEYHGSHQNRESQKLVDHIEKQQASQEAARAEETKKTLEDYARNVGSYESQRLVLCFHPRHFILFQS